MASALRVFPAFRSVSAARQQVWRAGARRTFATRSSLLVKRYTDNHEWIELDADGKIGTIGISEYAAKALGDVVYVELPEHGLSVAQGDAVGAVESVKSASDIYAPVAGKVIETNSTLGEKPSVINNAPEGEGWLAKLEIEDAAAVEKLKTKEEYDALEKDEGH